MQLAKERGTGENTSPMSRRALKEHGSPGATPSLAPSQDREEWTTTHAEVC